MLFRSRREQLASWLHGVARRAALDARARATRQKAREKRLGAMLPAEPPDQTLANELRAVLDEELARLPERHRAAVRQRHVGKPLEIVEAAHQVTTL